MRQNQAIVLVGKGGKAAKEAEVQPSATEEAPDEWLVAASEDVIGSSKEKVPPPPLP